MILSSIKMIRKHARPRYADKHAIRGEKELRSHDPQVKQRTATMAAANAIIKAAHPTPLTKLNGIQSLLER